MIIKSNFKDYYDEIANVHKPYPYSQIYKRETFGKINKEILNKLKNLIPSSLTPFPWFTVRTLNTNTKVNYSRRIIQLHYILFCGKIYPLLMHFENTSFRWGGEYLKVISPEFFYDSKQFFKFVENEDIIKRDKPDILKAANQFEDIFDKYYEHTLTDDIFVKLGSPIILYRNDKNMTYPLSLILKEFEDRDSSVNFVLNPKLESLNFKTIKSPLECYQELSVYYDSVFLDTKKTPVEVSNKDVILKHGFDLKTSFRKDKK